MNLPESVGNRIRELRKAKGWTQEQLAEAASLHYSYIGGVERGDRNISLETLEKIIAAFQVPAIEIFRFEDESDRRKVLDEHMILISDRSIEEIVALTKINREVIVTLDISGRKDTN
ncbi:transcriptional regulator [Paenibacillus sp. FSL R7-277]|uniref:Transcriptional regulator with XRE-family HTH domain n=1 Tax=Paenibacillus silagei TaxID=1670801 RepID=A0ABS4NJT0_9BACL|nr:MULTISPECIES: helix-turn-helix transcriptional regulator [Paenibacillus]ETT77065.1 transcriptional regulator [Paenibacillus sp. FSL R7-277]MBP2110284.1 transcriptional regulator with XRE-family HTH domain [Paenibacillus silagei]